MKYHLCCIAACLFVTAGWSATSESLGGRSLPVTTASAGLVDPLLTATLGDLLPTTSTTAATGPAFYSEIPPSLEKAVRLLGEENHSSATAELLARLAVENSPRDRARTLMWLGLVRGQEALDAQSWEAGTSASEFLRAAMEIDRAIFEAPDVARTLGEMVANGWSTRDPIAEATAARQRAEQSRRAVDFYYAGTIARVLAQKAWYYKDTTEEDRRYLALFAKAVACDPLRYESWTAYLPALAPNQMHDLMSSESARMFRCFRGLRSPLLADLGPAALYLNSQSGRMAEDDERFLRTLITEQPDDPYPHFELARIVFETTPALAASRFEEFLAKVDSGQIRLLPRENGYRISAMYKLAFLYQMVKGAPDALDMYRRVAAISPRYAETNVSIAALCGMLAEQETTGTMKVALLKEGIAAARQQEQYNYRGRARLQAADLRSKLRMMLLETETELGSQATEPR